MKQSMDITFQIDEAFKANVDIGPLKNAVQTTVQLFNNGNTSPGSIAIIITDNKTVTQLNLQYRDIYEPTDVLSFKNSFDPSFPEVDPAITHHLGDLIISYPIAKLQAAASGHTLMDEIILLVVHGMLHLLEFDHDIPEHKKIMWAAQLEVMTKLGLAHIQPTEV